MSREDRMRLLSKEPICELYESRFNLFGEIGRGDISVMFSVEAAPGHPDPGAMIQGAYYEEMEAIRERLSLGESSSPQEKTLLELYEGPNPNNDYIYCAEHLEELQEAARYASRIFPDLLFELAFAVSAFSPGGNPELFTELFTFRVVYFVGGTMQVAKPTIAFSQYDPERSE